MERQEISRFVEDLAYAIPVGGYGLRVWFDVCAWIDGLPEREAAINHGMVHPEDRIECGNVDDAHVAEIGTAYFGVNAVVDGLDAVHLR